MAHILDKAKKITLPWPNFGLLLVITCGTETWSPIIPTQAQIYATGYGKSYLSLNK